MNVLSDFKNIRAFILDVDGVLTDSSVLVFDDGQQVRRMNIKDGYALQLAVKQGYRVMVVSGGTSRAVITRLNKLGIKDVHLDIKNKKEILLQYVQENNLKWEEVLFMGDDIPDLEAMRISGLPCCPLDAVPEIKAISRYISPVKGGEGCVRDVIEKVLKLNGHWTHDTGISAK